jgi:hypothetical protein
MDRNLYPFTTIQATGVADDAEGDIAFDEEPCAPVTSSHGDWPADRKPGSYAFERLPSQQAQAAEADALEAPPAGGAAEGRLRARGRRQEPDVLVQLGARTGRADLSPWSDPHLVARQLRHATATGRGSAHAGAWACRWTASRYDAKWRC